MVIAETYPAEACRHIGLRPPGSATWSKRSQEGRRTASSQILSWAKSRSVRLSDSLTAMLGDGFGPREGGEDPLDAVIGLASMLEIVLGHRAAGAPDDPEVLEFEGWILGQQP